MYEGLLEEGKEKEKEKELGEAIERLVGLEMRMECMIDELEDRKSRVECKVEGYRKGAEEAKEDCEILAHQNRRLVG